MKYLITLLSMLLLATPLLAQSAPITDEVLDIAARMYCPVCENEPLNECRNATCIQWKQEISRQLQVGRTEDEIITYFVDRYGQKVVGVPTDPFLRGLSLFMPIVGGVVALLLGAWTFRQWRQAEPVKVKATANTDDNKAMNDYRNRLEQDLL